MEQQHRALERSRAENQVLLRLAQATFQSEVPERAHAATAHDSAHK